MAKKQETLRINFLSGRKFNESRVGRIITWALTVGKVIVFTSFAVIMGIFVYRFYLDKQIESLQEKINNNVNEIQSYAEREKEIRLVQDKLSGLKTILDEEISLFEVTSKIEERLPQYSSLENISIAGDKITLTGTTRDETYFAAFLSSLKKEERFKELVVNEISSGGILDPKLSFSMNITYSKEVEEK